MGDELVRQTRVQPLNQARARHPLRVGPCGRSIEFCAQEQHLLSADRGLCGHIASPKASIGITISPDYSPRQAIAQDEGRSVWWRSVVFPRWLYLNSAKQCGAVCADDDRATGNPTLFLVFCRPTTRDFRLVHCFVPVTARRYSETIKLLVNPTAGTQQRDQQQ